VKKNFLSPEMFHQFIPFTAEMKALQRPRDLATRVGKPLGRNVNYKLGDRIMTKTVFALLLLCLGIAACDPPATETNTNANTAARSSSTAPASPAPASSPVTEATPAAKPPLKAGDKVKVTINGSAVEATVVSVDEKLGKVTVKVQGESKEKTVAIADVSQ
jgi:hypothetical protein